MKHKTFTLVLVLINSILSLTLVAQGRFEDVVYLKNGTIIHGIIIEQVHNESIKIQTADRNIFVFKVDEVLKITKEEVQNPSKPKREAVKVTRDNIKKVGTINITDLTIAKRPGTSTRAEDNGYEDRDMNERIDNIMNSVSVGVQSEIGYQFNPHFSFGVGLGIHSQTTLFLIPFFADARAYILSGRITPFISLIAGRSFTMKEITNVNAGNNDKGGWMFNPAIGVKFFVLPKMALNLSLGYRYQEILLQNSYYNLFTGTSYTSAKSNQTLRLFNLRLGFAF